MQVLFGLDYTTKSEPISRATKRAPYGLASASLRSANLSPYGSGTPFAPSVLKVLRKRFALAHLSAYHTILIFAVMRLFEWNERKGAKNFWFGKCA